MNFGEWISCLLGEKISFETFTNIWSHVNKNDKKCHICTFLDNFGRGPPYKVSMNFGSESCCALSEAMSFEMFPPIWPHVNEKV